MDANKSSTDELEDISRVIHLGLTAFGVSAWVTGFFG
jgi:hypothetical protein